MEEGIGSPQEPLGWCDMDREQIARGIAATVPQLLNTHVETADARTVDAVAFAVERIVEEVLRWHDRAVLGATHRSVNTVGRAPIHAADDDDDAAALRCQIQQGLLPGTPASLQLAAAELESAVRRLEGAIGIEPALRDVGATRLLDHTTALATALGRHAQLLRREAAQLRVLNTKEHRDQVLARVVRAERRLTRIAMATLAA